MDVADDDGKFIEGRGTSCMRETPMLRYRTPYMKKHGAVFFARHAGSLLR